MIKKKLEIVFREKNVTLSKKPNSNTGELMEAYNKIAQEYSRLKSKPWTDFSTYLTGIKEKFSLPLEGILLDVGSGNGRNLLAFEERWEFIATDLSLALLKSFVSLPKGKLHKSNSDVQALPIKNETIDFILCIAVLHHLSRNQDVEKAMNRMFKILKPGGVLVISCWRKWKSNTKKKMIKDFIFFIFKKIRNKHWRHGDILLPWYNSKKEIIAKRYYHLFSRREIKKTIEKSNFKIIDFKIHGGKNNKDNFFVLLKK